MKYIFVREENGISYGDEENAKPFHYHKEYYYNKNTKAYSILIIGDVEKFLFDINETPPDSKGHFREYKETDIYKLTEEQIEVMEDDIIGFHSKWSKKDLKRIEKLEQL